MRIMALGHEWEAGEGGEVFCLFPPAPNETMPTAVPVGKFPLFNAYDAIPSSVMLTCAVPPDVYGADRLTAPCHVVLATEHGKPVRVKVINTVAATRRREFTVCVPPLVGDVPYLHVIEFMELSRLLGASHVMFYDEEASFDTLSTIGYYVKRKRATLMSWKVPEHASDAVRRHSRRLAATECLYRNMAISKYVVFMDINEYIVPHKWTNWHDMLQELETTKSCAYRFVGVFFDPRRQQDRPDDALPAFTDTWRTTVSILRHSRTIVKSLMMFDTFVSEAIVPRYSHFVVRNLGNPVALVHHYAECRDVDLKCDERVHEPVIPHRYTDTMLQVVKKIAPVIKEFRESYMHCPSLH